MATVPPPYTWRDQARQAARAQRDAMRAQRDYYRAQRRPSIVKPLLLISIGVIALLIESGKLNGAAFWDWYVRWWPLLLIGIGVASLGEWWLERDRPYGSRTGLGGIVFWIILLAILGSSSHVRMWHGLPSFNFSDNDDDLSWHMFGQEHDADVILDQSVAANAAVRIKDPHGDVTVTTSSDGRIHVASHDVVYASTDKEASRQLDRMAPKLSGGGSDLLLEAADVNAAHADLTIEVPEGVSLNVDAGHGDVSVKGMKSSLNVASGKGDVDVEDVAGPVTAHMSSGDFSAHSIGGTLTVDGRMDDVTLSEVRNNVSLNGDFFGHMSLEELSGPVYVHSSRTEITLASVPGNLTLDSDDLEFKNVGGPVRVVTRSKTLEGNAIHGSTHIENNNGDVTMSLVAPLGEIDIHNDNGSVDLTLPAKTGFNLDASTNDGEISTDFDISSKGSNGKAVAKGIVGSGGPRVSIVVDHGDIHIKKAGSVAATDDAENSDDDQPSPPPPPPARTGSQKVRHLRSSPTDETKPSVQ